MTQQRFDRICRFLDERKLEYRADVEQQRVQLEIDDLAMVIDIAEDGNFVKLILPQLLTLTEDSPQFEAALETLLHLGWEYKLARWQRDPSDGEVRLQADIPLEDSELGERQFWRTVQGTVQIAKQGRERVQRVLETGADSEKTGNQVSETSMGEALDALQRLLESETSMGEALDALQRLLETELPSDNTDPRMQELLQAFQDLLTAEEVGENGNFLALLKEIAAEARQGVRETVGQRLDLLAAALEAEYRSDSDPAQVYPVLDAAPQLLDDEFGEALQRWGTIAFSPARNDAERDRLASWLENFTIDLSSYPRVHPLILQKLAIVGYELVLQTRPRDSVPDKYARTLNNLGIAYRTQAELGETPSQNLHRPSPPTTKPPRFAVA